MVIPSVSDEDAKTLFKGGFETVAVCGRVTVSVLRMLHFSPCMLPPHCMHSVL